MSLERLLLIRAQIAHIGEKRQQNWWDSDALSREGGMMLSRLFPHTDEWAAIELAAMAAAAAHQRAIPPITVRTLFDLGQRVNQAIADLLLQKKLHSDDAKPYLVLPSQPTDLAEPSQAEKVRNLVGKQQLDRTVCIGDVHADSDLTDPSIWGLLVAGYQFSKPGHLVVPYLRVV